MSIFPHVLLNRLVPEDLLIIAIFDADNRPVLFEEFDYLSDFLYGTLVIFSLNLMGTFILSYVYVIFYGHLCTHLALFSQYELVVLAYCI